jgi:hypothetical protein
MPDMSKIMGMMGGAGGQPDLSKLMGAMMPPPQAPQI